MENQKERSVSRTFALWVKALACLLSVLLVLYAVPTTVYAELIETLDLSSDDILEESSVGDDVQTVDSEKAVFEVTDRREETVKHFRTEDGSFTAVQYNMPVHEKDENGEWQDIDNTLSESGSEYATPNAKIKFTKKIPGNEGLFTLHDGDRKLTMSLSGANKKVAGQVTNTQTEFSEDATQLQKLMTLDKLSSKILYPDILEGVDLEYVVNSGHIKENIIVKERADTYSYTFGIQLNNLEAVLCEDGSVALQDPATDKVVYTIPKGYMFDASGAYSDAVAYTLTNGGNGKYTLTVTADAEWINDGGRDFPVTVDPTVSLMAEYTYAYRLLNGAGHNVDYSNAANGVVGIGQNQCLYFQSYLGFIPVDSYVTYASIQMTSNESSNAYAAAYFVKSEWTGGSMPVTEAVPTAACWYPDNTNHIYKDCIYSWDLTDAVMRWRAGEPNYGVLIKVRHIAGYSQNLFFYTHLTDSSSNYPVFLVSYIIANGVEDYWSYATQDMGAAGAGAVNYATGELTFSVPTVSASDNLFGYTPALVYQSSKAAMYHDEQNNIPLDERTGGLGWHLSTDEVIIGTGYEGNYKYIDSDGTTHYIVSGKDEDGLGLSVTNNNYTATITDRSLNKKHFDNASYALNSEALLSRYEDAFGNVLHFSRYPSELLRTVEIIPNGLSAIQQLSFSYDEHGIAEILNVPYGDTANFVYSNYPNDDSEETNGVYLREIVFKPSTSDSKSYYSIYYSYTNEMVTRELDSWNEEDVFYGSVYRLSTVTEASTGRSIEYTYDTQGRVIKIVEKADNGELEGQTIAIAYGTGYTQVRSSGNDGTIFTWDDIITKYNFDLSGRVVGVYSTDCLYGDIYGAASSVYEDNSVVRNGIKTAVVTDGIYTNYLLNGGFDLDDAANTSRIPYWYTSDSNRIHIQYADDGATKAVKITPTAGSSDYFAQNIALYTGNYTLSFDYTPANSLEVTATVSVIHKETGAIVASKSLDLKTSGVAETVFDSLFINIESPGIHIVKFEVNLDEDSQTSNAYVFFDNIRLEDGTGCGPYSMLQFGHFENRIFNNSNEITYTFDDFWEDVEGNGRVSKFESQLELSGSLEEKVTASQTVYRATTDNIETFVEYGTVRSPRGTYIVSGFGKSDSAIASNNGTFMLKVEVDYIDRNSVIDTQEYEFPFLVTLKDKQYVTGSLYLDPNRFVKEIRVICDYSYQYGEAYFDDLSFIQASGNQVTEYEYYDAHDFPSYSGSYYSGMYGLLKSKKNGHYEENYYYNETSYPHRIRLVESKKKGLTFSDVEYLYDTDSTLPSEEWYTEYASDGTFTEVMITENTYNTFGLNILTESYTVTYGSGGTPTSTSKKLRSHSSYNTASGSPIFGAITSYTDTSGLATHYAYDPTTGRLQYEYTGSTGAYYMYDSMGRINGVYPLSYSLTGSFYYPDTLLGSVLLEYGSENELSSIDTGTTSYTFEYDEFGNTTAICAGDYTLAEFVYAPNNGKLEQTIYSNGYAEKYEYDHLDRLVALWYTKNDTDWICKYRYTYTDNGNQCRIKDLETRQTTLFRYDAHGKLLGKALTNDLQDTILFSSSYEYDDMDRMVYATTTYDYFVNANTPVDRTLTERYHYTDVGELYRYTAYENSRSIVDITLTYDILDRLDVYTTQSPGFTQSFDYTYKDSTTTARNMVSGVTSTINNGADATTSYTYDNNSNITKVKDSNGNEVRYVYDKLNQLTREDNPYLNRTYVYTYDQAGNRTSKKVYEYTTGAVNNLTPIEEKTYTYYSDGWGDRLCFDGNLAYFYDAMGNPTIYSGYSMAWNAQQLTSLYRAGKTYSFEYNADGIRTSKTVNNVEHVYLVDGTRIISEVWGDNTAIYIYDESGSPIGMRFRVSSMAADTFFIFYFEKNIFGDIVAIYNESGTKVLSYTYDAWGNHTVTWHSSYGTNMYAALNPFRYRGYYYDTETSWYYLQTRYYDPAMGRFISPDSPGNLGVGEALTSFNLYTYCGNNPVMGYDPMGTWNWSTFFSGVGLLVTGITAVVTAAAIVKCGGACLAMALVAYYTIGVGALTAAHGAAEVIEAATDFNPIRDTIYEGNEELYEGVTNLLKTQAEIGTMICGAYIGIKGGNVCFVAGTLVSTETGQIPIEEVEPGMLVWATDPETGETALKPVVQTFVNQTDSLVHVTVNGETITCTNEHPFYSPVKGWMAACQLRAGDILVMLNGERIVVEQVQHELLESPVTVYNFEVADYHTYFVGKNSILVHNRCKVDGSGHGSDIHSQRIDDMIANLEKSGNYTEIYGNRALKTAGLNGTQRPDIIAKRLDGTYEIWEFASKSQATGTRGYELLDAKIRLMNHNNPGAIFHDIIPW